MVEKFLIIEQVPVAAPRIKGFPKSEASSEKKQYKHSNSHLSPFSSAELKGEISGFQTMWWWATVYFLKVTDLVYRDPRCVERKDTQEKQTNGHLCWHIRHCWARHSDSGKQ